LIDKIGEEKVKARKRLSASLVLLLLSACATRPATVPDTTIIEEIQNTIDTAMIENEVRSEALSEDDSDLLDELIPSLSLDENLLAPVEERIDISTPSNLPASEFFTSLMAGTDYGIVISPDVDVNINLSLPNVTIEEAMDTVAEMYNLDITRRGNVFSVRPGGLRTRQFTIDYLNVQRQGSSSIQVTSGNSQNGGGNNGGNFGGGNFGGIGGGNFGGLGGANLGGIGGGNFGGQNGSLGGLGGLGGGGGAGGQISTSTSTDFWSDLETAISNLIGEQSSGSGSSAAGAGLFGGIGGIGGGAGSRNQSTVTDEGKSVLVQPLTGIIIVTAYPHELDRIEKFINAAQESLRREVIIQVQFLEVVLNKGFQYALDFNTFGQQANNPVTGSGEFRGNADGAFGSNNDQAGQFLSADLGIEGISNPLQFSTNFSDFDAVFQLLQTRGTTQVISSPQLRVLNNQKAVFQDGAQEFFQTQADTTTVASANNTTTNANNNLQQFFSGISMDITPQISANGEITLHVHPIISAVDEQTKSIAGQTVPLALTTTREIDSVIKAENGKIVVLGGLAFERNINETAGIPGVSSVPLLGDALEQRQTQSVKSEFIILLKPIMASEANNRDLLQESNDRFRDLNRAIDPFANN
jgi:MSHA biogenesis protein MshL